MSPEAFAAIQRDLGRLEGRQASLEAAFQSDRETNHAFFAEMRLDVAEIKKTITESAIADAGRAGRFKGGWLVLTSVGAALAAIGGLVITGLKSLFN